MNKKILIPIIVLIIITGGLLAWHLWPEREVPDVEEEEKEEKTLNDIDSPLADKDKIDVSDVCNVQMGVDAEAQEEFQRLAILDIKWENYTDFSIEEATIQYGFRTFRFFDGILENSLNVKLVRSKDGQVLHNHRISDPRERVIVCEPCPPGVDCPPCPAPEFHKEGEFTPRLTIPLVSYQVSYRDDQAEVIDTSGTNIIELYEREELPIWAFPEEEDPLGFKPSELLLRVDLSECMKKFCNEVALEGDPFCIGDYYSPETKIKGRITDPQGYPVEGAMILVQRKPAEQIADPEEKMGVTLYTDEKGEFILERRGMSKELRVKEGNYFISIRPSSRNTPNLKSANQEIFLGKGEIKKLDIILEQAGSIAGKVTDKEGNPITDARVYQTGFEMPRYSVCGESEAKDGVCELGTFVIPALDPGEYEIGAIARIGERSQELPPKSVKVEMGKTSIVNFILEEQ